MARRVLVAVVIVVVLAVVLGVWMARRRRAQQLTTAPLVPVSTQAVTVPVVPVPATTPVALPLKPAKKPAAAPKPVPKPEAAVPPVVPPMAPPPVEIHEELIPKNIEIIRVYYEHSLTGPGSTVNFDINGSGFTKEFEQMITVESGHENVAVKNLHLVTPNQIEGQLVVDEKTPTGVIFPRVLIQGKVVFQATDPFAVIRPCEVLNLVFTAMGETGRTGRFRVFTNLTEDMYKKFSVEASTPGIVITDPMPSLPFIVDATVNINMAVGGEYGLMVKLGGKTIFDRPGIIRVVRPNVGDTGLIQRITAEDGYHRPGDQAKFMIQGSGFQPQDGGILKVKVKGVDVAQSSIVVLAPGRMDMTLDIPTDAKEGPYSFSVLSGDQVVGEAPNAFVVVPKNWARSLNVDPPVTPGGKSSLVLLGRDFDKDFVKGMTMEADEPGLVMGPFKWVNAGRATAEITVKPEVVPGDYWIRLSAGKEPVLPAFGSIIQVGEKK